MSNKEDEVRAFLDRHYIRDGFGKHFDNKKAAAIASAIGYKGSFLASYDNGPEHAIYVNGEELILFMR